MRNGKLESMTTAERARRERDTYETGLKRAGIERLIDHIAHGPSFERRRKRWNNLLAIPGNVLEIGSYAWCAWIDPNRHPSRLHCINISESELRIGQMEAMAHNFDWITFHLMDAHKLAFTNDAFDLVYGHAIFHHLDCPTAFAEVKRVLKPGGLFVMNEPLGMNPGGKLVRLLTPEARTADEKPFDTVEINLAEKMFDLVDFEAYELFVMPAGLFSGLLFRQPSNPLTRFADAVDRATFTIRPLRFLARQCLMVLRKPVAACSQ